MCYIESDLIITDVISGVTFIFNRVMFDQIPKIDYYFVTDVIITLRGYFLKESISNSLIVVVKRLNSSYYNIGQGFTKCSCGYSKMQYKTKKCARLN